MNALRFGNDPMRAHRQLAPVWHAGAPRGLRFGRYRQEHRMQLPGSETECDCIEPGFKARHRVQTCVGHTNPTRRWNPRSVWTSTLRQ